MRITFATRTQAMLFEHELKGQISDGMWENTPGTGWEHWCRAEVLVGDAPGCRGYVPSKRGFAFHRLLDVCLQRMLVLAKLPLAFPDMHWDDCYRLSYYNCLALEEWSHNKFYLVVLNQLRMLGDGDLAAGRALVAQRLDGVTYTEQDLRRDLRTINRTMKEASQ